MSDSSMARLRARLDAMVDRAEVCLTRDQYRVFAYEAAQQALDHTCHELRAMADEHESADLEHAAAAIGARPTELAGYGRPNWNREDAVAVREVREARVAGELAGLQRALEYIRAVGTGDGANLIAGLQEMVRRCR